MGVTMRAGNGQIHGAYSGSRRRWNNVYVWMTIIAMVFGFGILFGVMGLHRLKDRRILSLLIKDKDDQILSLHLLLQKEREHTQEIKRKTEEMRIKMYNLRARKTELNAKISDMQSTISSLRDEQSTIESHLQEKQNEAKSALTEIALRKDAEIEDLKHHLQLCSKVESLNIMVQANETAKENVPGSETTMKDELDSIAENGRTDLDRRIEKAEQMEKEKNEYENDQTIGDSGNQEQRRREEDREANFTDSKGFVTIGNAESGKLSKSSQESENLELGAQENSKDERFRFGGKRGYLKRAKGKKWKRTIAKRTEGKVEGAEKISKKIEEGKNESILKSQQFGTYDKLQENYGENIENSPPGIKLENSTKLVDTEYTSVKVANYDISKNDGEHINSRGWIKVAETNEDSDDVEAEGFGESEFGTNTSTESARSEEDEDRTDEPEF